jgi:hypothetical protein
MLYGMCVSTLCVLFTQCVACGLNAGLAFLTHTAVWRGVKALYRVCGFKPSGHNLQVYKHDTGCVVTRSQYLQNNP